MIIRVAWAAVLALTVLYFPRLHAIQLNVSLAPVPHKHQLYDGLDCQYNSTYPVADDPDKECPFNVCNGNHNCTWWTTGELKRLPVATSADVSARCGASPCKGGGHNGSWLEGDIWKAADSAGCSFALFTPSEALQCLKGQRLVFVGDSVMRQLFSRLVAYIRGMPAVLEHYFHKDASYTFNATHDRFSYNSLPPDSVCTGPSCVPTGAVGFVWAPQGPDVKNVSELKPNHIVTSVMFHDTHDLLFQRVPPILLGLEEALPGVLRSLFWVTTPQAGAAAEEAWMGHHVRIGRNNGMRAAIAKLNAAKPGTFQVLDLEIMAAGDRIQRMREDHIHFQCSFKSEHPSSIPPQFWKQPENGDCRDMMGVNMIQVLLTTICCGRANQPAG